MTERDAVPFILDIAMEPREAQGLSQGPARHGTPTPSSPLGFRKLGAPVLESLASSPAPPGAPSPSWGNGKGKRRAPNVSKQPAGGALAEKANSE